VGGGTELSAGPAAQDLYAELRGKRGEQGN